MVPPVLTPWHLHSFKIFPMDFSFFFVQTQLCLFAWIISRPQGTQTATVLLYPASTTRGPHRQPNSISTPGAGCESVPCLPEEIVYFESVLGVQRANEYLMTVPPLLSAQADDLLTFRHSGPDKLLRAKLSVTGATLAPGGIDRQGYLRLQSRSDVSQRTTTTCWSDTSAKRTQELLLAQQKYQCRHRPSALAAAQYLCMSTDANVMRFHFDYIP